MNIFKTYKRRARIAVKKLLKRCENTKNNMDLTIFPLFPTYHPFSLYFLIIILADRLRHNNFIFSIRL